MRILYVIPARGGSKGIPHKNIRPLSGKPLICYSIDVARDLATDDDICVSTDDEAIIKVVGDYGLKVPFKRPEALSTDLATTNDVLLHAIEFYEKQGIIYDVIVLLQPTSPLRTSKQVKEATELYEDNLDMVVSVMPSHSSAVLCSENNEGFIELVFNKSAVRRQDLGSFYEYNGAIYVINVEALKRKNLSGFHRIKKYVMDEESSVDIDTNLDLVVAEAILNNRKKD